MSFDESWYLQLQSSVPLRHLPDYWLRNKTFMTPEKAGEVTERCADEYWDLCRRESPDLAGERNPDEPAPEITDQDRADWQAKRDAFFEDVHGIEKYDFRKQPHSPGWTPDSVLDSRFSQWFPEYTKYRIDAITAAITERRQQPAPGVSLGGFDLTKDAVVPIEHEAQAAKSVMKTPVAAKTKAVGRDVSGLKDIVPQDGSGAELRYDE